MKRTTNLLICLCLLFLIGSNCSRVTHPASAKIETLGDFENSDFYREYNLSKREGWLLKTGEYNNVYDIPSSSWRSINVSTSQDKVTEIGLSFHGDSLEGKELGMIYKLLQSMDAATPVDAKFKRDVERNVNSLTVHQIYEATPLTFGNFQIYAASIGGSQTIVIDRIGGIKRSPDF